MDHLDYTKFTFDISIAGTTVFLVTWAITGDLSTAAIVGASHYVAHRIAMGIQDKKPPTEAPKPNEVIQ